MPRLFGLYVDSDLFSCRDSADWTTTTYPRHTLYDCVWTFVTAPTSHYTLLLGPTIIMVLPYTADPTAFVHYCCTYHRLLLPKL